MRGVLALLSFMLVACATTRSAAPAAAPAAPPVKAPAWTRTEPPPSLPRAPRTEPRATRVRLRNGLEVIVVENHARPMVSIRLLFASGSAADSSEHAGVTYFTVNGLLATHDRKDADGDPVDPTEKSARRLVLELGASLRGSVTEDQSSIGIDGFSVDTEKYLARLFKIVQEARHGEDQFTAHVGVVGDLLDELEVSDSAVLEQFLGRQAFGEGHPYARPVYGTPESVTAMGIEDVVERQASLLVPAGSTLLVAGDVEPDAVVRAVERTFGGWKAAGRSVPAAVAAPAVKRRTQVVFLPRKPARTTLVCAARPLTDVKAARPALALLARVVMGRLSVALREERGFTYGASASLLELRGARALLACSRLDAKETTAAVGVFLSALFDLASKPLTDAELEAARAMLVAETEASADDLGGIVRTWSDAVALGEPVSLSGRAEALRAVKLDELQELTKKLVRGELFQVVMSGERALVEAAVKEHKLGALRTPQLSRVPVD